MLTGTLSQVSNQADWIESLEITDADTGDVIDLSDATEIIIEIKTQGRDNVLQSASLTDETVEHVETGVIQWSFTDTQMQTLCSGTYDVKIRITKDDIVTQLFIGTLPVLDG
jgi:hypothetical protein